MVDLFSEFILALTWRSVLIGALIFLASFLFNLAIVSFILVKLPADHFAKNRKTKFWAGPNPALHAAKMIGKNILGIVLVVLGIVLSLPGVPGQGLLTILLGVMVGSPPTNVITKRCCFLNVSLILCLHSCTLKSFLSSFLFNHQ